MGDDILSLVAPRPDVRAAYGSDENQFVDLRVPKGKGPRALAVVFPGVQWSARTASLRESKRLR